MKEAAKAYHRIRGIQIAFRLLPLAALGIVIVAAWPGNHQIILEVSKDQVTANNLKNAISVYHLEYGKYPVAGHHTGDVTLESTDHFMETLLGNPLSPEREEMNPRLIQFYPEKVSANGPGLKPTLYGKSELLDTEGNRYRILMDTDKDGRVVNLNPQTEQPTLPESILVWSAGPDGDFDTWEDNVKTW